MHDTDPDSQEPAARNMRLTPYDADGKLLHDQAVSISMRERIDQHLVGWRTRTPIPTAVIGEWFPAMFRPPGDDTFLVRRKVFLTPQGLYVYASVPAEAENFATGAHPEWYAAVDFAATPKPATGYAAMNNGIAIITARGKAILQPSGGCGCSARALKNWKPAWSRNRLTWEDGVKLAENATAGR